MTGSPAENSEYIRYAYLMEGYFYILWDKKWYRIPSNSRIKVILLQGTSQLVELEWSEAGTPQLNRARAIEACTTEPFVAQKLDQHSTERFNKVLDYLSA